MTKTLCILTVSVLAMATPPAPADTTTAFNNVSEHYEAIRQALIEDATNGVADRASAIRETAAALQVDFSAERAGVSADDGGKVRELLPEVEKRAGDLAAATGLKEVRAAFAELTKPLVRWQALVTGDRPIVVYCPMEKKSWLQPDEPVGNPYAPSMLRCGEVVSR